MDAATASSPNRLHPVGRRGRAPGRGADRRRACCALRALLLAVIVWWPAGPLAAQFYESFEGPEKSWRQADHDCSLRVTRHTRTFDQAQAGQASESIQFHAGAGTYIHLVHDIPPSRTIEELGISLWVKSNRAGLQLAARVVLPRSKDPRTGKLVTTLIRGSSYSQTGMWQKLSIDQPALLVSRQIPMLRSRLGPNVSEREAYVDLVVLNAYGGPGQTDLWLDNLELVGQVSTDISTDRGDEGPDAASASDTAAGPAARDADPPSGLPDAPLAGGGRSQLVRAIDHNGEPFAWLKSLGFNAVRVVTPPTPEQLQEAADSGLWLIAPPPVSPWPVESGAGLEPILAWDVGASVSAEMIESTRRLATQLRSVPAATRRPILCLPQEDIWQYSRIADLLVLEPPGPHGSLPLADLGAWYLQRARLVRLGTQFWASIRTQVRPAVIDQIRALGGEDAAAWTLEPEQIRLLACHAIASGARGLWFRSESRLDATDRHSILRAKILHWLNLELALLEPWVTTGQHEVELPTGEAGARASILKTDRSRLLLVMRRTADQQYVAGLADERPVTVEVPGVPETDEAYHLMEDGLRRLRQVRGTGMRITLEGSQEVSAVVLTQDRLVINYLARQINAARQERNELARGIAAQLYAAVVETHQQLLTFAPAASLTNPAGEGQSLSQARSELQHFERLAESGGHERAYEYLQRGLEQLAATRYADWKQAADAFPTPVSSPLCVTFFALPYHHALSQRLCGAIWGPNALPAGDFEQLPLLQSSGWRNLAGHQPELRTAVELSLHTPHAGRSALRIQCWPAPSASAPPTVEAPPIAIVSAPVPVQPGQILRVHGWARVPAPIQGSLDGLIVYDSLAGMDLAARIHESPDWREFTLYRAAPRAESVTLTFALTGIGEAWLDDVTVNVLEPAAQQALGPASHPPRQPIPQ